MTLIETLVAMAAGMVVVAALLAVLEVSLHQSSRLTDVAQATQLGRTTMTRIMDELHSACVAEAAAPVQATSTANAQASSNEDELTFINGYGGAKKTGAEGKEEGKSEVADVGTATEGVREDKLVWSPTAHTILDYVYYATGKGSNGEYTFASSASPATGVRIGEHITQIKEGSSTLPIFRYYAYASSPSTSTSAASSQLTEVTPVAAGKSMSAASAETVASVVVAFRNAPTDGFGEKEATTESKEYLGRPAQFVSQATFAFSAPRPEAGSAEEPCE